MKRIQSYILAILVMGLAIVGCTKLEEYESSDVLTKPAATLAVSAVADSSFTVDMSTDKAGILGYLVTSDTSAMVENISIVALSLKGEATTKANVTYKLDAAGSEAAHVGGLMPNTYYKVFVGATNTDGVESDVEAFMVKTNDGVGPTFKSSTPEISNEPVVAVGSDVVLTFDEPIKVDASKKLTFTYFYEGVAQEVAAEDISVEGSKVTVKQSHTGHTRDYFFLSWEAGAITDLSNNPCEARVSGVIDNTLKGNYYRFEAVNFAVEDKTVVPATDSVLAMHDFDVKIAFPFTIKLTDDYAKSMVKFKYENWLGTETRVVNIAEDITIVDDTVLVIMQPIVCNHGDVISLMIDEGAVKDEYGNINDATEYELSWNLGDFIVSDEITPEVGSVLTSQEFDVKIKFGFDISMVDDGTEGVVSMTYVDADGNENEVVATAYGISSSNDSVLVVMTPQPAEFGSKVYLNIGENVVKDADGNVNLELQESVYWDVPKLAASIDVLLGTYKISGASVYDPYDMVVDTVTIALVEGETNKVTITGILESSLGRETNAVEGVYDAELSLLSIAEQVIGTADNRIYTVFSNVSADYGLHMFVLEDGTMNSDYAFGVYDGSWGWLGFGEYVPTAKWEKIETPAADKKASSSPKANRSISTKKINFYQGKKGSK